MPGTLFFEVRITRITEALLLLARVYRRLEASDTDQITVWFRHQGLRDRKLRAGDPLRDTTERKTREDVSETSFTTSLSDLEINLVEHVRQVVQPLFVIFEFFELSNSILADIVDKFVAEVH